MKIGSEKDVQEEMELLIKIVLYLLLAIAFIGQYELKYLEINNLQISIHHTTLDLFILGMFILIFAFITYSLDKSYDSEYSFTKASRILTYFFVGLFIMIFLYFFFGALNDSLYRRWDYMGEGNLSEKIGLYSQELLGGTILFCIAIVEIIFMLVLIGCYYKKKHHN